MRDIFSTSSPVPLIIRPFRPIKASFCFSSVIDLALPLTASLLPFSDILSDMILDMLFLSNRYSNALSEFISVNPSPSNVFDNT